MLRITFLCTSGLSTLGRRQARTIVLSAITLLSLLSGYCFPWTTTDVVEVEQALADGFAARVPPGYEGKYASRMKARRWMWVVVIVAPQEVLLDEIAEAPRDHTVFFFGEAHVYTIPTAQSVEEVESDLYSRLQPEGYLPSAGERIREETVEFTVGERRVDGLRIEETSPLGRLVRYRVPVGSERILVAVGPADHFDEGALAAILASVRKRGRPMSRLAKNVLVGMLIALAVYAGLRIMRTLRGNVAGR